jgi:hypothetical protein
MKKLLPSALLALAAFGFVTGESFAGCFGLIPHHGCCGHCGCGATFCVRQYNAFSPVACGSLCLDGVAPFSAGYGGGCGACADGMCPGGFCGLNYSGLPAGPGCLGCLPANEDASPAAPKSSSGSNPVVTPSPLPSQMPSGPTSQIVTDRPIQNIAYPTAGYPMYAPVYPASMQYQPQIMVAPAYWDK